MNWSFRLALLSLTVWTLLTQYSTLQTHAIDIRLFISWYNRKLARSSWKSWVGSCSSTSTATWKSFSALGIQQRLLKYPIFFVLNLLSFPTLHQFLNSRSRELDAAGAKEIVLLIILPRIIAFLDFCLIEGMRHVGFELKNETNFDSNVLLSFKKAPTRLLTHTP